MRIDGNYEKFSTEQKYSFKEQWQITLERQEGTRKVTYDVLAFGGFIMMSMNKGVTWTLTTTLRHGQEESLTWSHAHHKHTHNFIKRHITL